MGADSDFFPRSKFKFFLSLVAAALVGGMLVLAALPLLLPHMLPETTGESDLHADEGRDLAEQQTAVINAVDSVSPAVVGVTRLAPQRDWFGQTSDPVPSGQGSGVIISPEGYIITNFHVINGASGVVVTLSEGQEVEAEIVGEDPGTDLALLKIDPPAELPWAPLGDSDALTVGEFVIAIGNPGGLKLERSVTMGIVSATGRSIEVYDYVFGLIQTDAAINPGNSGGPLVNLAGQVVGINSVKIRDAEGLGFSIPSNLVKSVSESLIEHGRVIRPMLGVTVTEITPSLARARSLQSDAGLLIVETPSGLPAQEAGLKPEDIIVEVQGVEIKSLRDLRQVLISHTVGDAIEVKVLRGSATRSFQVVLADHSAK